uniref:Secreted protein n=1 Tax=Anguilla anguilla TaxID=7936 RepID=A0A0E9RT16_ANGAN
MNALFLSSATLSFWVTTCNPLAVDSTEGNGAPYWLLAEHTLGRGPLAQCQVGRVGVIWDCHSVTTAPPIPDPSDTGQDIRIE